MKRKILLLLLLAFCLKGFGQTFTGDVVFFSQAEVVTFGANNYTTIDGNVQIGDPDGSDISDLSSLSTWQTITGNLLIDNTNLITLNGLNSLTSLGDPIIPSDERITLDLQSNTSLTDISALSGITSIGGIDIDFNTSLTSLDGLNNVTETTAVYLRQNNSLLDLSGLENLADIYSLTIENNDNITSLNGLQNLQGPLHFININNNPELTNVNSLSQLTAGPGFYGETINDNSKLTSFCGLFNLFNSAPITANVTINGNASNPSQLDIVNNGPCVYTSIPDNNFEAYLIAQNIDTEQIVDNRVLTSDISGIISLNVNTQNIADLTGIEGFTSLQQLWAWDNTLTSLDLSQNSALNDLQINDNQIGSIDLTNNPNLTQLNISNNNFSVLDVTQNLQLNGLNIGTNNISNIDLSSNSNLSVLSINNNPITAIDVSANTNLVFLNLNFNPNLNSVNAANGNNTSLTNLYTSGCPNLNCIQVDDVDYGNQQVINGAWIKDVAANYQIDCNAIYTAIPDDNFEQALIDLGIDTDPTLDDRVLTSAIEAVTFLNLTGDPNLNFNEGEIGLNIQSLEGIKAFINLNTLWAQGNDLTEIDLENMSTLTEVRGFFNQLTTINLNSLTNLEIIGLNGNQITAIDINDNTGLLQFDIANNDLMSLDIRNNTLLANMDIRTNPNLTCVLVTDVDAANSNAGFNKDPGTIYSLDCLTTVTAEFSQTLGEDFEANGGNLPKLLVTGTITNATSITVQDITTDVNVVVGEDYTFNNPTVINIPIGVYDGTLNTAIDIPGLAVLDDVDFESRAELNFQLNNFTGDITGFGSVTTTAYNISNDDYTAVVVATDLEASEEGLEVAGFAILLDGAVDSGVTVNVNYTITGSATNAVDYEELSGSVEILEGTNDATITIIPRQDPDVEGTEDLIITLSGGALYRIGDPSEASIEILDNDVAGTPSFILSKNIVATAEPNGSDSFTIVLNQQPATDVVIDIVSDNMGEAITDLSSLTFSNTDWDTPQTVTVIGQDDAVVDGTQNYVLTLSVNPAASDDVFDLVENQTVNGTNTDDEVAGTPGFTLSKNTVATAEPNGSDSFTVVLNTQPTSDVVIDIISNDLGEAIVAPTSLTFSNANWNIPQTLTVTGQDDVIVDGTQNYALTLSINDAASDDAYDALADQTVSGTNADDDVAGTPGFALSENSVATTEPGGTDSFTVVLNAQPASDVVIDIISNDLGEAIVAPTSLTFSNANWNAAQTVTVTGQDDAIVDGTQNYVLTLSVNDIASDDAYDALADQTITGTNDDDDVAGTPGFAISKNIVATTEPGGTDSFTVVLNVQPASNVAIDIVSDDPSEAIVAPSSLTFSNANWNIPQTLTVTGQDDAIVDGTQNYILTLSVNDIASDDAYDALADQTVSGTNADDEVDDSIPEIEQEDIKVFVKNATCKDIDNGEIQVDVFANYTFSVSLNDSNSAGTVTPGNPLILNNLANGPYNVCLSISEFPNWQQCFTSTITNFEDLVADILNVDSAEQSALISLQGSKSYKVNVNDITYNYDFDDISLKTQKIPLESGTNKVTIQGHSDCQGIFSEEITIAAMKYYPNPATEEVSIDGLPINEVLQFKIFSSTGKLVLSDFKETLNGKIRVDLKSLSAGFYFMKLSAKAGFFEYKILKK